MGRWAFALLLLTLALVLLAGVVAPEYGCDCADEGPTPDAFTLPRSTPAPDLSP